MSGTRVIKQCRDCDNVFQMTNQQVQWYLDRGWDIPERCPECRKKRRNKDV